ncbi:MAG: hypothetical protein K6T29_01435 [Peptococcaceae bacterium]|nr:hypothetical protein [Peptococcaceae bacterium]
MFKVIFNIPHGKSVAGNSPQGLCIPLPDGIRPGLGEAWIVETAQVLSPRCLYVRLIRRWRGFLADYEAIQKGQPDFIRGVLSFRGGVSFPLSETRYARLWEDYQVLAANPNAVIIRDGKAVRWRKKGKPPEEMPLYRFSTKYKRQPLLGNPEEIRQFLNAREKFMAQVIEEAARKKQERGLLQTAAAAKGGEAAPSLNIPV